MWNNMTNNFTNVEQKKTSQFHLAIFIVGQYLSVWFYFVLWNISRKIGLFLIRHSLKVDL